jgi:hypothetical protein
VNFQVLYPPFCFLFESLCLRNWVRVSFNLGLYFLFFLFLSLKKKKFTLVFLVKEVQKNQK